MLASCRKLSIWRVLGPEPQRGETVRELILKMAISIDGFASDLDGRNTWMFGADQEAKAWGVEYIWNASLHIMGSRSFRAMAAYWQTSTDQFAPPMNQIPKAVFSRQGPAILPNVNTTAALDEVGRQMRGSASSRSRSPAQGVGRRPILRPATWRRKSRS
jgi:hypothetical protein